MYNMHEPNDTKSSNLTQISAPESSSLVVGAVAGGADLAVPLHARHPRLQCRDHVRNKMHAG